MHKMENNFHGNKRFLKPQKQLLPSGRTARNVFRVSANEEAHNGNTTSSKCNFFFFRGRGGGGGEGVGKGSARG